MQPDRCAGTFCRTGGSVRGTPTVATYDDQDRLTTYNGVARAYNPNGEVQTIGTATLDYDVFGSLLNYTDSTNTVDYEIDAFNRRLGQTVNSVASSRVRYIYSPEGKVVGELDYQDKLVKRFVYATKGHVPDFYIDSAGNKFKIVTDHLGSVRMVVNSSSGVVGQYMLHDEFGVVLSDTSPGLTPFGYAGGLYSSESGMVRFGARDYDSYSGQWLAKDPIRFMAGDSNLYGYVMSDPINSVDPLGLFTSPADINEEANKHPSSGSGNGRANAFKHCYASCMNSAENGTTIAQAMGISLEFSQTTWDEQSPFSLAMDMSNNSTGIKLGENLSSSLGKGWSCPSNRKSNSNIKSSEGCARACQSAPLVYK